MAPIVRSLSRKYRQLVEQAVEDLASKNNALVQVLVALSDAEDTRIKATPDDQHSLSSGNINNTSSASSRVRGNNSTSGLSISPLDSLARGSAGREVSALVNALRLHKVDLQEVAQSVRALGDRLTSELRRELEVFSRGEVQAERAAELCEELLRSTQPEIMFRAEKDVAIAASDKAGSASSASSHPAGPGSHEKEKVKSVSIGGRNALNGKNGAESSSNKHTPPLPRPPFDLSS